MSFLCPEILSASEIRKEFPTDSRDVRSLFFGASGFAFPSYFLMSLCGILPRVIVMTIVGEVIPMRYMLIAVLVAVPAVLVYFAVSAVRKKKQGTPAEAGVQTSGDDRSDPE